MYDTGCRDIGKDGLDPGHPGHPQNDNRYNAVQTSIAEYAVHIAYGQQIYGKHCSRYLSTENGIDNNVDYPSPRYDYLVESADGIAGRNQIYGIPGNSTDSS